MTSFVAGATDEANNAGNLSKVVKRSYPSGSPTSSNGSAVPKCVCAPATHARSFKCRLHRVNSPGQSHQPVQLPRKAPTAPPTRTVEAL